MDAATARAEYLVALIGRYATKQSRILEVGCREGDNLASLWHAGFTNLEGLESNAGKVVTLKERYPDLDGVVGVAVGPIGELTSGIEDESFDLVFTVGFLFDRTGDYGWLFPELARLTRRYLISIEKESAGSFKDVYEGLGLKEIEAADLEAKEELESVFFARVFEKAS
jgi:Methyltransferase domain